MKTYVADPKFKRLLRQAPRISVEIELDGSSVSAWVGTLQSIAAKADGLTEYEVAFLCDLSIMVTTQLREAGAGVLADLLDRSWENTEDSPLLVSVPTEGLKQ